MASNKGLGKGLGALLGDFSEEPLEQSGYRTLPIYKVEPNPEQPRREFDEVELQALADSITVHGVIQPLTVREMPNGYSGQNPPYRKSGFPDGGHRRHGS